MQSEGVRGCILLNFYIKPQPYSVRSSYKNVVSYWISTSNHNSSALLPIKRLVVSYWISTSNHNSESATWLAIPLYLIEFLHQTTTALRRAAHADLLYLIEFLHQTTTSKHVKARNDWLYLIEFLHQTTTALFTAIGAWGCILLNFYIKPQLALVDERNELKLYLIEFLHQTTTRRIGVAQRR